MHRPPRTPIAPQTAAGQARSDERSMRRSHRTAASVGKGAALRVSMSTCTARISSVLASRSLLRSSGYVNRWTDLSERASRRGCTENVSPSRLSCM